MQGKVESEGKRKKVILVDVTRNTIEYRVFGRYALFSDPICRMGGEKLSYPVPTYQALKGITESIYWKPSILWRIDAVRVLNPIRTENKSIRPISYTGQSNTLSVYTYLVNPVYEVRAHFIPNPYRSEPDVIADGQNENKHHCIAKRMVKKGGRRDIFLGTRECQAYVEPCEYGRERSFYQESGTVDLGVMFHSFIYADESKQEQGQLGVRLWHATMTGGEIRFLAPEECDPAMCRMIRPMVPKKFGKKYQNFSAGPEGEEVDR